MVFPLLPIMAAGLAVSAGANLYTQYNQRRMYRQMANAYQNLDRGYSAYLTKHGRTINPNRAWTSYYGQYRKAQTNLENSYAGSVGTLASSVGYGAGLYRAGMTSRRL